MIECNLFLNFRTFKKMGRDHIFFVKNIYEQSMFFYIFVTYYLHLNDFGTFVLQVKFLYRGSVLCYE